MVLFKRMHDEAKEPVRSTAKSAGLDLFASESVELLPLQTSLVSTGITFETEDEGDGWFIGLYLRSSLAMEGLMLGNGVGVVDADYAGNEIKVLIYNASGKLRKIEAGEKIAQMVIQPHSAHLATGVTVRHIARDGGFGSTGNGQF